MEQLIAYTKGHLQREEALMASIQFPQLSEHKIHHAFARRIDALKEKYDAGNITVAAQLSMVLRDWLFLHSA